MTPPLVPWGSIPIWATTITSPTLPSVRHQPHHRRQNRQTPITLGSNRLYDSSKRPPNALYRRTCVPGAPSASPSSQPLFYSLSQWKNGPPSAGPKGPKERRNLRRLGSDSCTQQKMTSPLSCNKISYQPGLQGPFIPTSGMAGLPARRRCQPGKQPAFRPCSSVCSSKNREAIFP